MKSIVSFALLVFALAMSWTTSAETQPPREIGWEELLPPSLLNLEKQAFTLGRQLQGLSNAERDVYDEVASELLLRDQLADGMNKDELTAADRALLKKKPSESNPEATTFWKKFESARKEIEAQSASIDPALNGKRIRMPGYALPLDFEGTAIKEFLLVPYVGACVHTPPPPANQIVFVRADKSFESEGIFAPVWVEGRMLTEGGEHLLFLVDGERGVDAGYTLEADKIEPYRE